MRLIAFLLAAALLLPSLAQAQGRRVALVVGMDGYEKVPRLRVAVADAKRMKETLESLDPPFDVSLLTDADWKETGRAFDAFLDRAKGAEFAFVYFAGHGIEYHGENFLLVKDTDVSSATADVARMKRRLASEAVSLQNWMDMLESTKAQAKVVVLDCCRNNPLRVESDEGGTRSVLGSSRGLAQVAAPSGTLISYSAAPGEVANDGLFTEVLVANMKVPGLSIGDVFAKTRQEVREISSEWAKEDAAKGLDPDFRRSRHVPMEHNLLDLSGMRFTFTRGVPEKVAVAEPRMTEAEIERRAKEMAEKLVAEAMKNQPAPPSAPSSPAPMARPDPAPAPAFPASRGMEGGRAGEVREFGGIAMVWCPAGSFTMGSPADEPGRDDDEKAHKVTLTRGFWLAKTETTQGQWASVMSGDVASLKAGGEKDKTFGDVTATGAQVAMYFTSWDDAQGWLKKMNERHPLPEGWKWELPTEAQWEYACRAGTETAFSFGSDASKLSRYANFADKNVSFSWKDASQDDGVGEEAAPVGKYEANAWGLHDMHGNVWEWCRDYYGDYPSGATTDPAGASSGGHRVLRGGGWFNDAAVCRSAIRAGGAPGGRGNNLGFRPALVPSVQ